MKEIKHMKVEVVKAGMKEPKEPKFFKGVIRGIQPTRFYNGKWQDGKRRYRFKNERDNPAAIMRDILKRTKVYNKGMDKVLGQLYLYADGKIDGFML